MERAGTYVRDRHVARTSCSVSAALADQAPEVLSSWQSLPGSQMRRLPSVFRLAAAPIAAFAALIAALWPITGVAQIPLTPVKESGQTVTPVFEGWYPNPDGTYSLSFGYFNRNAAEVVEIPIGPDNFIQPGDPNQGQPTSFQPRRHWGVFAVKVPADFGDQKVVWTLKLRGETFAIPARLRPEWQIDALEGEAGGNTPPVLKLEENGPEGRGPLGVTVGPLSASVGRPLTLNVWAADDGNAWGSIGSAGKQGVPVAVTYFKHQGPGQLTFSVPKDSVDYHGGKATVSVTFSEPGAYILRVRANDASGVADAGHAQCCWTNGFVRVTVTK